MIEARELTKRFGEHTAVDALTFTVRPGIVTGFLARTAPGADARAPAPGGRGLAGMRERVAAYGAEIEAGPRPDGGWRVHTRLRLDDGAAG